jgi:hypothetical protein
MSKLDFKIIDMKLGIKVKPEDAILMLFKSLREDRLIPDFI